MARRAVTFAFCALVLFGSMPPEGRAALGDAGFVRGEVVCVVRPGGSIAEVNREYRTTTLDHVGRIYRLRVPAKRDEVRVARTMREDENVETSGLNVLLSSPNARRRVGSRNSPLEFPHDRAGALTADPRSYDAQPFMERLRIENATSSATGVGVVVAVIDTGVDLEHPALRGHLLADGGAVVGYDFVDDDADPGEGGAEPDPASTDPDDPNAVFGHGTFVAGLVAKVAPGALVMPIRAFGPDGVGTLFGVIKAVAFARDHGADVVNMSFGAPERLRGLEPLISEGRSDVVFVAAAGNENSGERMYPASQPAVISVAAVDDADAKAAFSNYGKAVDLSAPGVALVSAYPGGKYATWSGTSFAAPIVSATAALVLSRGADAKDRARSVADRLKETAAPLATPGVPLGSGRVDPVAALTR